MNAAGRVDERSPRYIGWRVVAAMFIVEMTIFGFGLYGQGIYVSELRRLNGWPTAYISTGVTLCLVIGSSLSMFVSDLLRWIGPRHLVFAGIAALAASQVLLATAASLLQLYIGFLVFALAWVGLGTITTATIVGSWFDQKRGLAISLTFTGATFGGIALTPGLVLLVERIGYARALTLAAGGIVMVLVPVIATIPRVCNAQSGTVDHSSVPILPRSRFALLRDPGFWSLTAPFALALFVQVAFIVHEIAILETTIGFQQAGVAVSLTTAMALVGRIGLGLFVDRVDPRKAAALSIITQAAALLVIGQSSRADALLIACAIFGFSIGNLITLPALVVQREFAPAAFGVVLGLTMAITGIFNACGPAAMGALRDMTGSYDTPLLAGVVIQVLSAIIMVIRPRKPLSKL